MGPRNEALERLFGTPDHVIASPIPFYLGGDPTVLSFPSHVKNAVVYCTSELTGGWGSGQTPGPLGEYEFAIVLPKNSPLGPRPQEGNLVGKGWSGVTLCGFARYSLEAVMRHGETSGPLPPQFAPFTQILFVELGRSRIPFEFGGARYGLLLLCLITDSERDFVKSSGPDALIARLRAANAFPVSDPARKPVA
jgi:hypothetical protein